MSVVTLDEWQQFIAHHPDAHFMQTGEWGELKSSFGWKIFRLIKGVTGAQILFRKLPFGFTVAYIPKGPVGQTSEDFWVEIDNICRSQHAIFLKVELDAWQIESIQAHTPIPGFKSSPYNIQPPNTILVDLGVSEADLLQKMRQKTRYNINLASKKGVVVRTWEDIPAFHRMLTVTGSRDRFGVHTLKYYQRAYQLFHPVGMCELLLATYADQPLAALLVFAHGKRAWYVYGASSDLERNRMPTYLLQWEAMLWAKKRACLEYDLWGIPDEPEENLEANFNNRTAGLWGVYRFKRGFGGQVKRNVQALDKVYSPILYALYLKRMAVQTGSA